MKLTSPVTLNLMTPVAMRAGLKLVGFEWNYQVWDTVTKPATIDHLYFWGKGETPDTLGATYIGIDESEDGHRVRFEYNSATTDYIHAHARAVVRTGSTTVSAPLIKHAPDLSWAHETKTEKYVEALAAKWQHLYDTERPLRLTEQFAIRLSVHLGDTGVPVNSEHKGAWGIKSVKGTPVDDVAEAVAQYLEATHS